MRSRSPHNVRKTNDWGAFTPSGKIRCQFSQFPTDTSSLVFSYRNTLRGFAWILWLPTGCPICSWTGLGWLELWVSRCLSNSAWAGGQKRLGKMVEKAKSKSTQPRSTSRWDTHSDWKEWSYDMALFATFTGHIYLLIEALWPRSWNSQVRLGILPRCLFPPKCNWPPQATLRAAGGFSRARVFPIESLPASAAGKLYTVKENFGSFPFS